MLVTPVSKKFGKYKPGEEFEFPDKTAAIFIRAGKLYAVAPQQPGYFNRMMRATSTDAIGAPYGVKSDGTPRKRPGRPQAAA